MINGFNRLASSRDQGSAFDTLRSQVTKSPQTNSKGASKATFLQAIENTMTDPADKQTMMCGSKLSGEKRMRTPKSEHAHNWAQKFKNAWSMRSQHMIRYYVLVGVEYITPQGLRDRP